MQPPSPCQSNCDLESGIHCYVAVSRALQVNDPIDALAAIVADASESIESSDQEIQEHRESSRQAIGEELSSRNLIEKPISRREISTLSELSTRALRPFGEFQ